MIPKFIAVSKLGIYILYSDDENLLLSNIPMVLTSYRANPFVSSADSHLK